MAGPRGYQTKHCIRLVVLLVLVCLAAGLVQRVTLFSPSPPTHHELVQPNLNPEPPIPRLNHIHGRWEAVRASLGLPPLTHRAVLPPGPDSTMSSRPDKRASRFDLGRKRRADEATRRLPLALDTRTAVTAPL